MSRLVVRTSPPFKVGQFTTKLKRRQSEIKPSYCSPSHFRIQYFSKSLLSREENITKETDGYFKARRRRAILPFLPSFL